MNQGHASPLLEVRDVSKSFGAVAAARGVSFPLFGGEAHALVGENGAGKSTIVKMLAGVHQPDTGAIVIDGDEVRLTGPADAQAAGIAVIYQEPTLFPDLSVAENIFMGRQPLRHSKLWSSRQDRQAAPRSDVTSHQAVSRQPRPPSQARAVPSAGWRLAQPLGRLARIDRAAMKAEVLRLFDRLGVRIDPDRPARGLSIADQQLVEIAKALSLDARVLVMDEPTAALSGVEVERLFTVARTLCAQGAAVLFISHRFDEVFALCQRLTVMRDGAWVSTDPVAGLTVDQVVRRMVGRDVSALFPKADVEAGDVVLEVSGLRRHGVFSDIGFTVRAGEIVALAGLVGAGRSEVVRAVFGIDRYDAGEVRVAGNRLATASPAAAMAVGVALVPEDRRQQGLVMEMSIERNATLTRLKPLARLGLLTGRGERRAARDWAKRLRVKYGRLSDAVSTLSGGNQQKVVLAKWLATAPKVLIVDEPTRGIDVGTKAEVHRLMSGLAAEGVAVVMVSSELPEVLGMADRVLVMHEGRITAELSRDEATEESIMFAATGQKESAA